MPFPLEKAAPGRGRAVRTWQRRAPLQDLPRRRYIRQSNESTWPVKLHALLRAGAILLLLVLLLLAWEFGWRARHDLRKPGSPAPDGAWVAEVRALPLPGDATGVFLRTRHGYLRSLAPRLVFSGECDEVDARWFGARRLLIECELRAGEPRLLHALVGDVVIEVVVQRRYAGTRSFIASRWNDSDLPWASRLSASFTPPSSTSSSTKFIASRLGST